MRLIQGFKEFISGVREATATDRETDAPRFPWAWFVGLVLFVFVVLWMMIKT